MSFQQDFAGYFPDTDILNFRTISDEWKRRNIAKDGFPDQSLDELIAWTIEEVSKPDQGGAEVFSSAPVFSKDTRTWFISYLITLSAVLRISGLQQLDKAMQNDEEALKQAQSVCGPMAIIDKIINQIP